MLRTCPKCGEEKLLSLHFTPKATYCKACVKENNIKSRTVRKGTQSNIEKPFRFRFNGRLPNGRCNPYRDDDSP